MALNSSGDPIPGAKLNFYETGTTTRKDTYSDRGLTTANTNPVIANGSGRFGNIWLESGDYKVVFTDANDVVIYTVDPYNEVASTSIVIDLTTDILGTDYSAVSYITTGAYSTVGDGGSARWYATGTTTLGSAGTTDLANGFIYDSVGTQFKYDNAVVNAKAFAATGDGTTDDTTALQNAVTFCMDEDRALFVPSGTYRVTSQINAIQTSTDADGASGLTIHGEGTGKTVFTNEVSSGAMIYVQSTSPYFAKGGIYEDFTILGDGVATSSNGIRTKGAWLTTVNRVRIKGLKGIAFLAGDDTSTNPDTTANSIVTFNECQFESNYAGFKNPVNNNSPQILFNNCNITNNERYGIKANSSYIMIKGGAVSFNGIHDGANAEGGIIINEETGTTFSAGYRAKGVRIENCELDTNYPLNVDLVTCENPVITGCSTQFRDYAEIDWSAAGITQFPAAQFRFGGTTSAERCLGAVFENNRVSIKTDGEITFLGTGHTIFYDDVYAQSTKIRNLMYNLEVGAGVAGTDWFILKEADKTASGRTDRKFYVDFKYPVDNITTSTYWPSAFSFQIDRVLPSYMYTQSENMNYAFTIADDSFKQITVPQVYSEAPSGTNYNMLCVTFNGQNANSAILLVRATTGPSVAILTNGSTNINTATGPLNGTTGTDTKLTVSADTDGTVYIENRLGATYNVHCSWLLSPGLVNQL